MEQHLPPEESTTGRSQLDSSHKRGRYSSSNCNNNTVRIVDAKLQELIHGRTCVQEQELTREVLLKYVCTVGAVEIGSAAGVETNTVTSTAGCKEQQDTRVASWSLLDIPKVLLGDLLCFLLAPDLVSHTQC
jgi:hypothetical protein